VTTHRSDSDHATGRSSGRGGDRGGSDQAEPVAADLESLATRAKTAGAAALEEAQGIVEEAAPKAGAALYDAAEAGRAGAASAVSQAAQSLEERAEGTGAVPEKAAEYAAEGMRSAAGYLKERDAAEIVEEAEQYVKDHPVRSVAIAVVAGFFVGRMLR